MEKQTNNDLSKLLEQLGVTPEVLLDAVAKETESKGEHLVKGRELGLTGADDIVERSVRENNPLVNYVYITATDEVCDRKTKVGKKISNWTKANNRHVPSDLTGVNAQKFILDVLQVPCPDSYLFLPTSKDEIKDIHGERFYNTFSERFFPEVEDYDSGPAQDAVEKVNAHLAMLYGEEYKNIILDYIAHNVQYPGKKILWALCMYGSANGTGKSIPTTLCQVAMGDQNINKIANASINSNFTSWTQGGCVAYCDEIEIKGQNMHQTLATLKDVIGNPKDVSYIPKGKDEIKCPNTQNYLFTTNRIDALPLEAADRRWCVVDDGVDKDLNKIHDYLGLTGLPLEQRRVATDKYFNKLYADMETYKGAFRKWLLDRDISHFSASSRAPTSQAKEEMVEAARSEPYHTVKDILEERFDPDVVVLNELVAAVNDRPGINFEVSGRRVAVALADLGYETTGRVKIDSKNQTVFKRSSSGVGDSEAHEVARKNAASTFSI